MVDKVSLGFSALLAFTYCIFEYTCVWGGVGCGGMLNVVVSGMERKLA